MVPAAGAGPLLSLCAHSCKETKCLPLDKDLLVQRAFGTLPLLIEPKYRYISADGLTGTLQGAGLQ